MGQRKVVPRLTSIWTFLGLLTAISPLDAQDIVGEISALVAIPTVQPIYPVSNRGSAPYIVYDGEPFVVRVALEDESQARIRGTGNQGWLAAVRIDLQGPNGEPFAQAIPLRLIL